MDTIISQSMDLTRTLAAQASAVTYDALPEPVRAWARQCVLDYYGVALAGADDPLATILLDELAEAGGAAQAIIIGHQAKLPALSAALVNGAIGHALDYDDVNLAMPGHPDRGFHATGTVGAFGAAAACAHLLGLDAEATARALGIAGTQAAGLKSQFGTMCKPFHAGKASQSGLLAARLAARGFSSRPDLVECEQGFALTHAPDFDGQAALAAPASGFHIFANLFKYHAACYLTHGPIESARALRERHGVKPEQIARMTLSLDKSCERVCNIPAPTDGLEAKFSLRQTVAMALSGVDTASLAAYSSETATDPALVRLRDKLALDFRQGWPQAKGELEVTLGDGRVLRASHDAGIPSSDIAVQRERLVAKFDALAEPVLGAARARELRAAILGLDRLADVGALTTLAAL